MNEKSTATIFAPVWTVVTANRKIIYQVKL